MIDRPAENADKKFDLAMFAARVSRCHRAPRLPLDDLKRSLMSMNENTPGDVVMYLHAQLAAHAQRQNVARVCILGYVSIIDDNNLLFSTLLPNLRP